MSLYFQVCVENKTGVSNWELICEEFEKEDAAKREQKKQKRKKKQKNKKKEDDENDVCESCGDLRTKCQV